MRKFRCFSIATLALSIAACGNSSITLYPVVGKVTYNGKPATGAAVFFHRHGADSMNEHLIMGIVQEDGSFELVCGSLGKGAPAGVYDVTIEWKQSLGQSKGKTQHGQDKLNGRYADPRHPLIQVTIQPERNELAPFHLAE